MLIKNVLGKKTVHQNSQQPTKSIFVWNSPAKIKIKPINLTNLGTILILITLIFSYTTHAMQEALNKPSSSTCEQTQPADTRLSTLSSEDRQLPLSLMPLTQPTNISSLLHTPTPQAHLNAATILAAETEQPFLLESLIKLESDNIDLLTLARDTLESVNILDGFEKQATTYKIGLFSTNAAATLAWLMKHNIHPVHRSRMSDGGNTRETVNIALDIITRLLPPTILALGSWFGWCKIKNTINKKYETLYTQEVKKLNTEIEKLKTKLAQDTATLELEIEKKLKAHKKKDDQERSEYEESMYKKIAQQNREIEQARLNTVQALQAVLSIQDDFKKQGDDLIARIEKKDSQRGEELRAEQKQLIDNVAQFCQGITNQLVAFGTEVRQMRSSNEELKKKIALTAPQFQHLFSQLAVIKANMQPHGQGAGSSVVPAIQTALPQTPNTGFIGRFRRRSSLPTPDEAVLERLREIEQETSPKDSQKEQ